MRKITPLALLLLLLLSACALVQRRVEVLPWPPDLSRFEGEGDLDFKSRQEHFSGSFLIKVAYPDHLFLEVYGPFGQTLLHLRRDDDQFLLIAGEERTTDEKLLVERFHFTVQELMDDLAMKGERNETPDGFATLRKDYKVYYGHDRRGRRNMCWKREDGSFCLAFNEITLTDR